MIREFKNDSTNLDVWCAILSHEVIGPFFFFFFFFFQQQTVKI
jgi:hypothetical protein